MFPILFNVAATLASNVLDQLTSANRTPGPAQSPTKPGAATFADTLANLGVTDVSPALMPTTGPGALPFRSQPLPIGLQPLPVGPQLFPTSPIGPQPLPYGPRPVLMGPVQVPLMHPSLQAILARF